MRFGFLTNFRERIGSPRVSVTRTSSRRSSWATSSDSTLHGWVNCTSSPASPAGLPLMILAAAAQRTRRIRLGTAVTLLPLHNPVKMAEDAATLDVLSNGRLEFGIGEEPHRLLRGLQCPAGGEPRAFEESLEVILRAWTSERLSYEGKYFRVQDVRLTPSRCRNLSADSDRRQQS